MNTNERKMYTCLIILTIITIITANNNPFFQAEGKPTITTTKESDKLLTEIKTNAKEYEEEPEDAYVDRVWKKTPGRNGRKVNIEKSYKKMKKSGQFNDSLLVFDEVPPSVSLHELPSSPIYRGHPEKEMVALLINVSWGTEHIPTILTILNKKNVKATFFIEGKWAKENKNIVKMIVEQDHLIGNHAYNHPDMAHISVAEMRNQIENTNEIIEAITGYRPKWFAPPSGSFNDQVVQTAHELEMETILWTVDTIDWKNPSVSVMINRVIKNIHPGATILMHPTEPVAQGLETLIDEIKQKEYEIGTIEHLLSEER
ncbi:polysaccharide deacetylase family protein [Pseudogracilibacillus auburnensis]|uniref:Putative sporulation protein (Polysaccharide deacetylase family) n=1 Tax=Pseudogracilibacillus auburnensis TaxID=1494959 RepID=A0A2V3W8S7_9BACI|nr:polysaccharide deacetylase family protein [Pseudogracilibacillus auburnensis]MBO1003759.1 polysaccharide deacetylase family protein [Pseudogracilibacillus auburnensis]PXW88655.1 putative sporulation protein (polysaccharide deacetylase family) [Pseudogracilibacillus auburnensis]